MINNLDLFNELRNKYEKFIYKDYELIDLEDKYEINYYYSLNNEIELCNKMYIYKKEFRFIFDIHSQEARNMIFNIGLVESISYYKLTCSKIYEVRCGQLDEFQINWWKKLIYNGLGELRYLNGFADVPLHEFIEFNINLEDKYKNIDNEVTQIDSKIFDGNLVPVGGGKDSIVTLEILKKYNNTPFMFYHRRKASYDTCFVAGFEQKDIFEVDRILDEKLFELNATKQYLNGHVPISSMIAFVSYLSAFLLGKKYICLSNESSSNEGNIEGTNINHQYSKSYEFEKDFNEYAEKYLVGEIKYFSLLRPVSEYQITKQLIKYKQYLPIFRSCNQGIKENVWCGKCPKCLFVYSLLLPLLGEEETIKIFNKNMLDDLEMDLDFRKLIGLEYEKPFECVGTKDEIIFGLQKYISENKYLPALLEKYREYITNFNIYINYNKYYNLQNFVPAEYEEILKENFEI